MTDTTAKKAAAPKKSTPPPAFDFTALKPETAKAPVRKGSVEKADNPTIPWVRESWDKRTRSGQNNGRVVETGEGRKVVIPTANVTQFKNLLNYAARDLGIGVAISYRTLPGNKTEVTFAAKTRKQKKAETPATPATGNAS